MLSLREATAFRRPLPSLIEAFDIPHPALPAELDGLTVLHISDLHIRRFAPRSSAFERLAHALGSVQPDLIAFTGDLMDAPGQERGCIDTLAALVPHLHPRVATLAIFGNHDTPLLRRLAPAALPSITFLSNAVHSLTIRGRTHHVLGLSHPEDPMSALLPFTPSQREGPGGGQATLASSPITPSQREGAGGGQANRQRSSSSESTPHAPSSRSPHDASTSGVPFLTLAHHPTCLIACADLNLPLVLAGHTHAGQIRVSPRLAPHTSSDVPAHLATGALRLRQTLMLISRGVGDGVVETLRINCPKHLPLYRFRRAPLPPPPRGGSDNVVTQVMAW